jgi:prepilin-type N-terminal cleavage/methylation domain-containing protein
MNVKALSKPVSRSRGVTLVEILLVISLLVILLSFAMPTVGNATARAELKATLENVHYSVAAARNVARMSESSVAMNIEYSPAENVQKITFSRPEESRAADMGPEGEGSSQVGTQGLGLQEYRLPAGIRLVSDHERFVFDPRGVVGEAGRIMLVSAADESISSAIDVE